MPTDDPRPPAAQPHRPRTEPDTPAELDELSATGSAWVKPPGLAVISAALVGLAAAAIYGLWIFWPERPGPNGAPSVGSVNVLGYRHRVSEETRLFVVIGLAGFLGGLVHALRSFVWYVGNRQVRRAWIPFYFLTPMVGAGLGTIFYLVFRGGLLSNNAGTEAINPWGFAAVAALVGLFSNEALERLKCVAEQLFAKAPTGEDHAPKKEDKAKSRPTGAGDADARETPRTPKSPS